MSDPGFFEGERWLHEVLARVPRVAALAVARARTRPAPAEPFPEVDEPILVMARPAEGLPSPGKR